LAAGEAGAGLVEAILDLVPEAGALEAVLDDFVEVALAVGEAVEARPVGDVLEDRLGEGIGLLKHHAHPGAQRHHVHPAGVDVLVVEDEGARHPADVDGVVHAVQGAQEGGFATARGADHGDHLVLADVDADVEDRLLVAVEDIHVAHAHLRFRHEGAAHGGVIGAAVHHRIPFPNPGRGPGHVFYVVRGHCSHGVLLSVSARYQRRSRRLRSHTAAVFITIKKASSTMMAAEVFSTKARSGLSDQRNICTGSTVAGDAGPVGMSTIKATMPIINSGAVSPRAWAMPMMAPVSMPGIARGST